MLKLNSNKLIQKDTTIRAFLSEKSIPSETCIKVRGLSAFHQLLFKGHASCSAANMEIQCSRKHIFKTNLAEMSRHKPSNCSYTATRPTCIRRTKYLIGMMLHTFPRHTAKNAAPPALLPGLIGTF